MSDGQAILLTIAGTAIGVAAGAVASWYFSRRFYLKSGTDLDAAMRPLAGNAQKLLQATNALGRMLEKAGIGKANYDAAGDLTGLIIDASVHESGHVTDRITATVTRAVRPQYDRQHEQPPSEEQEGRDA